MKIMKLALRFWIALTSVISFLIGWAMLAHAPKPVQAKTLQPEFRIQVTPLATLVPLPSMDFSASVSGGGVQVPPITIQQPPAVIQQPPVASFSQAPLFSTGGS